MSEEKTVKASELSTREVVGLLVRGKGDKFRFILGDDDATDFIKRVRVDCSRCRGAYQKKKQLNPKMKMLQFRLRSIQPEEGVVVMWTDQSAGNAFDEIIEDMGLSSVGDMLNG